MRRLGNGSGWGLLLLSLLCAEGCSLIAATGDVLVGDDEGSGGRDGSGGSENLAGSDGSGGKTSGTGGKAASGGASDGGSGSGGEASDGGADSGGGASDGGSGSGGEEPGVGGSVVGVGGVLSVGGTTAIGGSTTGTGGTGGGGPEPLCPNWKDIFVDDFNDTDVEKASGGGAWVAESGTLCKSDQMLYPADYAKCILQTLSVGTVDLREGVAIEFAAPPLGTTNLYAAMFLNRDVSKQVPEFGVALELARDGSGFYEVSAGPGDHGFGRWARVTSPNAPNRVRLELVGTSVLLVFLSNGTPGPQQTAQLAQTPESAGAFFEVHLSAEDQGWTPKLDDLRVQICSP